MNEKDKKGGLATHHNFASMRFILFNPSISQQSNIVMNVEIEKWT